MRDVETYGMLGQGQAKKCQKLLESKGKCIYHQHMIHVSHLVYIIAIKKKKKKKKNVYNYMITAAGHRVRYFSFHQSNTKLQTARGINHKRP
jgi:hypothetical protein